MYIIKMMKSVNPGLLQGTRSRAAWSKLSLAIVLFFATVSAFSQPVLRIHRLSQDETTTSVHWTLSSDDSVVIPTIDQLRVTENDTSVISLFDYSFPEPGVRYPMTAALVLDKSGSMKPVLLSQKAAAHAFIDELDGVQDEAAVVWFSSEVDVEQSLTTSQALLHQAVDRAGASGATVAWDAAYAALEEIRATVRDNTRILVLLTDSFDGSSSHASYEIIALARQMNVRLFTIGVGPAGVQSQLQRMADETGGRAWLGAEPENLRSIMLEIARLTTRRFDECELTYIPPISCLQNQHRSVRLTIDSVFGQTISDTAGYFLPYDSTTLTPVRLALGSAEFGEDGVAYLPLLTDMPFPQDTLPPFHCELEFNKSAIEYLGLDPDTAVLLNWNDDNLVEPIYSGLRISLTRPMPIRGNLLARLRFGAQVAIASSPFSVQLRSSHFEDGCLHPVQSSGYVYFTDELSPELDFPVDTMRLFATLGDTVLHHITLYNTGAAELGIRNLNLAGLRESDVVFHNVEPVYIPARSSAILTLKQTARRVTDERGNLWIDNNTGNINSTHKLPLHLVVRERTAALPPEHLGFVNFGWIPMGDFRDTVIHVSNPNAHPLNITQQILRGRDASLFQIVRYLADEIPAFSTDSLVLRFGYFTTWSAAAFVEIQHDAGEYPASAIQLRAETAWPAWPIPRVEDRYIDFDDVIVGSFRDQSLILHNDGGVAAKLLSMNLTDRDSARFSIETPFPSSIEAHGYEQSILRFTPLIRGYAYAYLECHFDHPYHPMVKYHLSGSGRISTDARASAPVPDRPGIVACYPNPFHTVTTVLYSLPRPMSVELIVYDLLGRMAMKKYLGPLSAGEHATTVKRGALRPGVYVAVLRTADGTSAGRIIVAE